MISCPSLSLWRYKPGVGAGVPHSPASKLRYACLLACCCLLLACLLLACAACAFWAFSGPKTRNRAHTETRIARRALARWKDRRLISDDFFVRTGTRDLRVRAAEKWSKISRFLLGYGPPRYRDWYLDIFLDQSHNIKFCARSSLAQEYEDFPHFGNHLPRFTLKVLEFRDFNDFNHF